MADELSTICPDEDDGGEQYTYLGIIIGGLVALAIPWPPLQAIYALWVLPSWLNAVYEARRMKNEDDA